MKDIRVKLLKKQAKLMHRLTGEPHKKCLNALAEKHGFKNWDLLMMAKNKELEGKQ